MLHLFPTLLRYFPEARNLSPSSCGLFFAFLIYRIIVVAGITLWLLLMLITDCWLLIVDCLLLIVDCFLVIVVNWIFDGFFIVDWCFRLLIFDCWLSFLVNCWLLIGGWWLLLVDCWLMNVDWWLVIDD